MALYLDTKNDLIFNRIFGEHPKLLDESAENVQISKAAELCEMGAFTPEEQ